MVSRVEGVLIAAILFFAWRDITAPKQHAVPVQPQEDKLMELREATLYEVNQTRRLNTIKTARMIRYREKTLFEDFKLYTPTLILHAAYAQEYNGIITLDRNATIYKADGTRYYTEQARYDRKRSVLELEGGFRLSNMHGEINGSTMHYNSLQNRLEGSRVRANYEIE